MEISKPKKYGFTVGAWIGFLSINAGLNLAKMFNVQNKWGNLSLELGLIILMSFISVKIMSMILDYIGSEANKLINSHNETATEEIKWDM